MHPDPHLESDLQESLDIADARLTGAELDAAIDRALERIRDAEQEIARVEETYRLRVAPLQQWYASEVEKIEHDARFWKQRVEALAAGYDFGRKKSKSLPCGTFGYRQTGGNLKIADPTAAVAFARENGLPVVESVQITPLAAHFKSTGEIPAGCEFAPVVDAFFVKTGA